MQCMHTHVLANAVSDRLHTYPYTLAFITKHLGLGYSKLIPASDPPST